MDKSESLRSNNNELSSSRLPHLRTSTVAIKRQHDPLIHCLHLLQRHVVINESLTNMIVQDQLLTETYLHRFQATTSNDERIKIIVEAIDKQGNPEAINRFCDILQVNGHSTVANLLRNPNAVDANDIQEVWDHLHSLGHKVKEFEKDRIVLLINNKVKEEVMKVANRESAVKEDISESKRKQMEMHWKYQREFREVEGEIKRFRDQIAELQQKLQEKDQQLHIKERELKRTSVQHDNNLMVANRYNMANDNSLHRAEVALEEYRHFVQFIKDHLDEQTKSSDAKMKAKVSVTSSSGSSNSNNSNLNNIRESFDPKMQLDLLRQAFMNLLKTVENLLHLKSCYENLKTEVGTVIRHMLGGGPESETYARQQELNAAYHKYQVEILSKMDHLTAENGLLMDFINEKLLEENLPDFLFDAHQQREREKKRMQDLNEEIAYWKEEYRKITSKDVLQFTNQSIQTDDFPTATNSYSPSAAATRRGPPSLTRSNSRLPDKKKLPTTVPEPFKFQQRRRKEVQKETPQSTVVGSSNHFTNFYQQSVEEAPIMKKEIAEAPFQLPKVPGFIPPTMKRHNVNIRRHEVMTTNRYAQKKSREKPNDFLKKGNQRDGALFNFI